MTRYWVIADPSVLWHWSNIPKLLLVLGGVPNMVGKVIWEKLSWLLLVILLCKELWKQTGDITATAVSISSVDIYLQRFAIRCMRELKLNRGLSQRNSSVACKICSKEFTAAATLMYHYRSHASMYHTSISQSYIISYLSIFRFGLSEGACKSLVW